MFIDICMKFETVKKLPENKGGRDFIVGDIHGCFSLLEDALSATNFDEAKDRLISVGDLVDRGPESERAMSFLQKDWFYAVRGNHDEMALQFSQDIMNNNIDIRTLMWGVQSGARWLLEKQNLDLAERVKEQFSNLPYAIEVITEDTITGVVHAEVAENMNWADFKNNLIASVNKEKDYAHRVKGIKHQVMWGRNKVEDRDESIVEGVDRVFVGHSPLDLPMQLGNVFYIDTAAAYSGYLTLVETKPEKTNITSPKIQTRHFRIY